MSASESWVGVGEAHVSSAMTGSIVTHALGSCLAVTIYDPELRIGGMLHAMLPGPPQPNEPNGRPEVYLTSGLPRLQRTFESLGGSLARAIVCAAGSAVLLSDAAGFRIGARNWAMLRKLCFTQGLRIAAQDVGGNLTRNLTLDLATGEVTVSSGGTRKSIWSGADTPRRRAS